MCHLGQAAVATGGGGADKQKKDTDEDTGATAKNVGLEFDAQAYGEQLQRTFSVLLEGPHAHAFSDVTLVVHGEKVGSHSSLRSFNRIGIFNVFLFIFF